jgi:hypothetical protein
MRRRSIEPRRVIFIGVEGKSDQAFARFLGRCCEEASLHLHLDVRPGSGDDSVAVVEEAVRYLRHSGKSNILNRLVLLDRDRIKQDLQAGRDAQAVASRAKLEIIFQEPNLEGLLIRLHQGPENRIIAADNAMAELKKVWPEYSKQLTADQLIQRFALSDVQRAAQRDSELQRLLEVLGL